MTRRKENNTRLHKLTTTGQRKETTTRPSKQHKTIQQEREEESQVWTDQLKDFADLLNLPFLFLLPVVLLCYFLLLTLDSLSLSLQGILSFEKHIFRLSTSLSFCERLCERRTKRISTLQKCEETKKVREHLTARGDHPSDSFLISSHFSSHFMHCGESKSHKGSLSRVREWLLFLSFLPSFHSHCFIFIPLHKRNRSFMIEREWIASLSSFDFLAFSLSSFSFVLPFSQFSFCPIERREHRRIEKKNVQKSRTLSPHTRKVSPISRIGERINVCRRREN